MTLAEMLTTLICSTLLIHSFLAQECTKITGEGVITSPNYPADYDRNVNVCWEFTADEQKNAVLSFDAIDMEQTEDCIFDSVQAYDDFLEVTTLGGPVCYNDGTIPDIIVATGQEMLVRFRTDGSVQYSGFSARFQSFNQMDLIVPDETEEDLNTNPVYGQFNQISLPDGMCGDHQMYNAVQDVFNKLRNFRYNEFEFLAYVFEDIGVNISSSVELKRLACYMSDINSVEQIAPLYVVAPTEYFVHQFHAVAPYLRMLHPKTIRQGLLSVRKLIQWVHKTGFPLQPLMDTTYADTWQFFTELQSELPESFVDDVMAIYRALYRDPNVSLFNIFTISPEALTRASHDINNDVGALHAMFDSGSDFRWSPLGMISRITTREFSDIEHIYTPFVIALVELESVIFERGWFEL